MTQREAIPTNLTSIFQVTDQLLLANNTLPALILIYACLDILASLQRQEGEGNRKAFVRWVDSYLLPDPKLKCTALDLYAARCAILHTLTPDAELTRKGEARRIVYAWGQGEADKLVEASRRLGYDHAAIHIGELHERTKAAAARFLETVEKDPVLVQTVERAARQWLLDVSTTGIDLLLERTGGWPAA